MRANQVGSAKIDGFDRFDSRALRYTDCYGQRFLKEGRFAYNTLPLGAQILNDERPYVVNVRSCTSDAKMIQSTVSLAWDGRCFVPDQVELEIEAGDLVLWHCPTPTAPAYTVVGDKAFFSSATLASECGYSHAFTVPGTYEWADALGSGVGGTVVVTDPSMDSDPKIARWKRTLTKGELVMIGDGKADPARVQIVTGQTVFFAVSRGPVTVTDRALIGPSSGKEKSPRKTPKKKASS